MAKKFFLGRRVPEKTEPIFALHTSRNLCGVGDARKGVDAKVHIALLRTRQIARVPDEPESGHIRGGVRVMLVQESSGAPIQPTHLLAHLTVGAENSRLLQTEFHDSLRSGLNLAGVRQITGNPHH